MDNTTPITKNESRTRNDYRAAQTRYSKRTQIDKLLEQRRLEHQLREVWA